MKKIKKERAKENVIKNEKLKTPSKKVERTPQRRRTSGSKHIITRDIVTL